MPSILASNVVLDYPIFVGLTSPDEAVAPTGLHGSAGAIIARGRKKTSHVRAIEGVSFRLHSGDRLGLVGRNGSGKSTLLRVLAGVYEPTQGHVITEGQIAPLFNVGLGTRQEASGRQNIILRGLLRGLSRKQAAEKVDEIIEFSELGQFIDMPVRTYSAGMAMRLSFSIATAFSPEILLLDEWIGAGDKEFQGKARDRMNDMVNDAGITVIASHHRQLIRKVCGLALWMDKGKMRAFGPVDEVYQQIDEATAAGWPHNPETHMK